MDKIKVRIVPPPPLPDDPEERRKVIEKLSKEGCEAAQRELEFLLKVMEEQKKAPPSDWLIGRAA